MKYKTRDIREEFVLREETTLESMNNAYVRIKRLGGSFFKVSENSSFDIEKRKNMIMHMISYFETREEFEKCQSLMNLLKKVGVNSFSTKRYM